LDIADITTCVFNILGVEPKLQLAEWRKNSDGESFPLRRSEPWNFGLTMPAPENRARGKVAETKNDASRSNHAANDELRHSDRRVLSLIDIPLWSEAKWTATAYAFDKRLNLPYLALGFRNVSAAKAIFNGLRNRLGEKDSRELLRVSIITGIDKDHPSYYRVLISANHPNLDQDSTENWITTVKMNTMQPPDLRNLDGFLAAWRRAGRYCILPALYSSESQAPQIYFDHGIEKCELHVRPAWEIGENDPDIAGMRPTD
jgi:hypothetical protein